MNDFIKHYPIFCNIDAFDLFNTKCHYYRQRKISTTSIVHESIMVLDVGLLIKDSFNPSIWSDSVIIRGISKELGYHGPLQLFFDEDDVVFDIITTDGFMSWNLMNSVFSDFVHLRKPEFTGVWCEDNPLPIDNWIIKPSISLIDDSGSPIYVSTTTDDLRKSYTGR